MRKGAIIAIALLVVGGAIYQRQRMIEATHAREKSAREAALRDDLAVMRNAIARFHKDNQRYPHSLEELVPNYLRRIPVDPLTNSAQTWRLTTEETVQPSADFTTSTAATESYIIDVHSGAGAPYSSW